MNSQHPRLRKILSSLLAVFIIILIALVFYSVFVRGSQVREVSVSGSGITVKLDPATYSSLPTKLASTEVPDHSTASSSSAKSFDVKQVVVPSEAEVFYVILQEHGKEKFAGSSETIDVANRSAFLKKLPKYIEQARQKKRMLIVTAATSGEQRWVHAQIKYQDAYLKPARYKDPGSSEIPTGVEIPIE